MFTSGRRYMFFDFVPEFETDTITESYLAHPAITIEDNDSRASIYLCDVRRGEPMHPQYSAVAQIDELIAELTKVRAQCVAFSERKK